MVIPSYGMATMVLTGVLMMSSNLVYYLMFPMHIQTMVVEGAPLRSGILCVACIAKRWGENAGWCILSDIWVWLILNCDSL